MSEKPLSSSFFEIRSAPLDPASLVELVRRPYCGAVLLFVGTTRDHFNGKRVVELEYEAYESLAKSVVQEIASEIESRWPGTALAIEHRIGIVEVMEPSVAIAVATAHREQAYLASRYAIDELKKRVPIWKLERFEDGFQWKENEQI